MNNKGFMMAEVVVVSAIVLVALVGLYTSYNKVFSVYNQRVNYYDVDTLYKLANYRDNELIDADGASVDTPIYDESGSNGDKIYLVELGFLKDLNVSNTTFVEYRDFLESSLDFDEMVDNNVGWLLVMENCDSGGITNCKYAYLEVDANEFDV